MTLISGRTRAIWRFSLERLQIKDCVDSFSWRYKLKMDDSSNFKEDYQHYFDTRLAHVHFLGFGRVLCEPLGVLPFVLKEYKKLKDLGDIAKWFCGVCSAKLDAMRTRKIGAEEYTDLHNLVGNVVKMVKEMASENIKINNRLSNIEDYHLRLCQVNKTSETGEIVTNTNDSSDCYDRLSEISNGRVSTQSNITDDSDVNKNKMKGIRKRDNNLSGDSRIDDSTVLVGKELLDTTSSNDILGQRRKNNETDDRSKWHQVSLRKRRTSQVEAIKQGMSAVNGRRALNKSENNTYQEVRKGSGARQSKTFFVGNSDDCHNLKFVDRKVFMFVSRVSPEISENDFKLFLNDTRKCDNVVVKKLESKYPSEYSSFKVGISESDCDKVFQPDFWPRDAFVDYFRHNLNSKAVGKKLKE
ncbi:hypothetical protein J6590_104867 [Homalodisca vitripennis]|nr:hypothetical protein J6590_104867 [Homalodisca vitripennis]